MNPKETYNICDSLPEVVQKNKTNVLDLYDIIGNFTGTFVIGKYYNNRDIVVYNGSQYYCIAEGFTASKTPDVDDKNWVLYLLKGETGETGPQGPQGPKGETGSATLDVDSLNGLLSGGNGIETAKNTAGDKVEVKLSNNGFTIGDTTGTLSDQTITINPQSGEGAYISVNYHGLVGTKITPYDIRITDPGGDVSYVLTSSNVKTILGKSIYGSGNIDVYRHSIVLYKNRDGRPEYCSFNFYSSSNLKVASLTDLITLCGGKGRITANGWCGTTHIIQIEIGTTITDSYIYYIPNEISPQMQPVTYSINDLSFNTFDDTVTTV